MELLEACREEFHRRLKVYHAWKSKNRKGKNPSAPGDRIDDGDEERAPKDILDNGKLAQTLERIHRLSSFSFPVVPSSKAAAPAASASMRKPGPSGAAAAAAAASNGKKVGSGKAPEQRYFRIPFIRPNDQNREASSEQKKKGWWYAHFDGESRLPASHVRMRRRFSFR